MVKRLVDVFRGDKMSKNYWERHVSRRRVMAGAGAFAAGLAAVTVVGCGGSDKEPETIVETRVNVPKNTSTNAKKGGTYKGVVSGDENNLDPLATSRVWPQGGSFAYSHLLKEKVSDGVPGSPEFIGDLAESYEISADGLTIIFKLRPDAGFDPRPPTSSRKVNAEDVVFSWNKYKALSPYKAQLSYEANKAAAVESITKVDDRTVTMKLAYPWSPVRGTLSWGQFVIQPIEADSAFDSRRDTRGSHMWMLSDYQTAQSFKWSRNPNWYDKSYQYLDSYETPVIPEYAARLAQFRAQAVHELGTPAGGDLNANASDIIDLANSFPDLQLVSGDATPGVRMFSFGTRPNNPFKDVRLRQAVSLTLDRELFGLTSSGGDIYQKASIPFEVTPVTMLSSALGDYWLDPKGGKLGNGAKYYTRDIAEAKKLMSAAGFANGLKVPFIVDNRIGHLEAPVLAAMVGDAGFQFDIDVVDYQTVFLPKILVPGDVKGDYDGVATIRSTNSTLASVSAFVYQSWHSQGAYPAARVWDDTQKKIDGLIESALREFDIEKEKSLIWEAQKINAEYMSAVPYYYSSKPFSMAHAFVKNYGVYKTTQGETGIRYDKLWLDQA